jgi:hypothetical protein
MSSTIDMFRQKYIGKLDARMQSKPVPGEGSDEEFETWGIGFCRELVSDLLRPTSG